jgi:hypothetical protein
MLTSDSKKEYDALSKEMAMQHESELRSMGLAVKKAEKEFN